MSNNKTLRIFMLPQEFPCGEQSSCCGPVGHSEDQIQNLKSGIEKELGYEVEVIDVKDDDAMGNHPQVVKLFRSLGPTALPILALGDEVVSMAKIAPEKAIAAIRKKVDQG